MVHYIYTKTFTKRINAVKDRGMSLPSINITTLPADHIVGRVFANGAGDLGSIPGRVIPKTLKLVLDTSLLNTQQNKVSIKD